jgi:hypothetical protein
MTAATSTERIRRVFFIMFLLTVSFSPPRGRFGYRTASPKKDVLLTQAIRFAGIYRHPFIIITSRFWKINGKFSQVVAFSSQMVYNKSKKKEVRHADPLRR